jgi:predicted nucleic acid-binding protein
VATLVDTSVWIDLFRGAVTPQVARLKQLLGREELLIGDLILAEILQGIADESEAVRIERALEPYEVASLVGASLARRSAMYYRQLRRKGITVRKTIDCLIATWCVEHHVALLHADRDFAPFIALGLIEA